MWAGLGLSVKFMGLSLIKIMLTREEWDAARKNADEVYSIVIEPEAGVMSYESVAGKLSVSYRYWSPVKNQVTGMLTVEIVSKPFFVSEQTIEKKLREVLGV